MSLVDSPMKSSVSDHGETDDERTFESSSSQLPIEEVSQFTPRQIFMKSRKLKAGETLSRLAKDGETGVWSELDPSTFNLRVGPDYQKNGRKEPSGPCIANVVAVDLLTTQKKVIGVMDYIEPPPIAKGDFLFVISCALPAYGVQGYHCGYPLQKSADGPNHTLVLWTVIPQEKMRLAAKAESGHLYLLNRFINAEPGTPMADSLYQRFKLIGRLGNPDEVVINSTVRALINKYNAKPMLTRPQHKMSRGENWMEVCVDAHNFGYIARQGLSLIGDRIKHMLGDWAFVIEGRTDDELPEALLCAVRFHKVDRFSSLEYIIE